MRLGMPVLGNSELYVGLVASTDKAFVFVGSNNVHMGLLESAPA